MRFSHASQELCLRAAAVDAAIGAHTTLFIYSSSAQRERERERLLRRKVVEMRRMPKAIVEGEKQRIQA